MMLTEAQSLQVDVLGGMLLALLLGGLIGYEREVADKPAGLRTQSILFTAAVGVAVALSQSIIAVGATGGALLTLRLVRVLERRLGYKTVTNNEGKE